MEPCIDLYEIKLNYPNTFCRYIRFFNPGLNKLNNAELMELKEYFQPQGFDQLNQFFNSQGIYLDILNPCEKTDKTNFYYQVKRRDQNNLKTVFSINKEFVDYGTEEHNQLLSEAFTLSFAAIEMVLQKNVLAPA